MRREGVFAEAMSRYPHALLNRGTSLSSELLTDQNPCLRLIVAMLIQLPILPAVMFIPNDVDAMISATTCLFAAPKGCTLRSLRFLTKRSRDCIAEFANNFRRRTR